MSGSGFFVDYGFDSDSEGGDEGSKYCLVYDSCHVIILVSILFILNTIGSASAHPVGFVAS